MWKQNPAMLLLLDSVNSASSSHMWRLVIDAETEGQRGETVKPCAQEKQSWADRQPRGTYCVPVSTAPSSAVRAHKHKPGFRETVIASPSQQGGQPRLGNGHRNLLA